MGCAIGMVKYLVFIFNLVFALAGLALLIIGVLFKLSVDEYTTAITAHEDNFAVAPTLLIVIGCIIFVIAFFGCCGAIKESTCMLTTYAVILLVIFILQVAIGVFAILQVKDVGELKPQIQKALQETFDKYNKEQSAQEAFDLVQKNLKCCGVTSPKNWENVWTNQTLPLSCCEDGTTICKQENCYKNGCSDSLTTQIDDSIKMIGYVACGIAAVEIIGAIFALCLSSSIRNQSRRSPYA